MRRKQATALIDEIRTRIAEAHVGNLEPVHVLHLIASALERSGLAPLEPCGGEAHSNPFIDNCHRCAPRWGWVGPVEVVS